MSSVSENILRFGEIKLRHLWVQSGQVIQVNIRRASMMILFTYDTVTQHREEQIHLMHKQACDFNLKN